MFDRTDYDLRFEEHKRRVNAINGEGWKYIVLLPMPAPRKGLAALLRAMAARLDPVSPAPRLDGSSSAPAAR